MFQPRKTLITPSNPLSISINDTKKREKRENKYLKIEKEIIIHINLMYLMLSIEKKKKN